MRDKTFTLDAVWSGFCGHVAGIGDPRAARGLRHPFAAVVALTAGAMLAGRNTVAAISRWASDAPQVVLQAVGARRVECVVGSWFQPPGYDTFRRVLATAAADQFAGLAAAATELGTTGDDLVRLDGKRLRGAAGATSKPLLAAALDSAACALAQVRAYDGDELGAARGLIHRLDLEGKVVSADAAHCRADTARAILDAGADYVLTLKGNNPTLLHRVKALPWNAVNNAWATRDRGHGRAETRTIGILACGGVVDIQFPGVRHIARVRRWTRDLITGKTTHHTVYILSSLDVRRGRADRLSTYIRAHWMIESWHWIRDNVFAEDACQVRCGTAPQNLASLRNLIIAILKTLGDQGITATRDHIANHPYTTPLRILGIANLTEELRLC